MKIRVNIVLEFSFVGMKTHEEKPGNRSVLNVQLQSMSTDLEEVMVVAYGTTKKEAFTGSAISVSGEQVMKEAADAISPEKALKGYVAGVRISRGADSRERRLVYRSAVSVPFLNLPILCMSSTVFPSVRILT